MFCACWKGLHPSPSQTNKITLSKPYPSPDEILYALWIDQCPECETLNQRWVNVGPPSTTMVQHCPKLGSMSRVCWVCPCDATTDNHLNIYSTLVNKGNSRRFTSSCTVDLYKQSGSYRSTAVMCRLYITLRYVELDVLYHIEGEETGMTISLD